MRCFLAEQCIGKKASCGEYHRSPSKMRGIFQLVVDKCSIMKTSSNGNIFRVTGHLCGEFTGPGEFPAQRPVTRSFDVCFDLSLNKRLNKQSRDWWFETQSRPLWRHCNDCGNGDFFLDDTYYVSNVYAESATCTRSVVSITLGTIR